MSGRCTKRCPRRFAYPVRQKPGNIAAHQGHRRRHAELGALLPIGCTEFPADAGLINQIGGGVEPIGNELGIGDEFECGAEISRQRAADVVNPRPFRFDDKSQTNRRVRTKTKEKKSEFRRKTAKVEVMKIVETINIVDRLQKPVSAQLILERNWVGVFSNSISCSMAEKDPPRMPKAAVVSNSIAFSPSASMSLPSVNPNIYLVPSS